MANEYRRQEAAMATLINRVPQLLRQKGWNNKTFVIRCMEADLGQDTAYRFLRGDTNFTAETIAAVARVLGVSTMGEVIEMAEQ